MKKGINVSMNQMKNLNQQVNLEKKQRPLLVKLFYYLVRLNKLMKVIFQIYLEKLKKIYRLQKKRWYYKKLIKSVLRNQGKIIVVFPVIPWNFRWQRPQQILVEFAKNGYTIIYLSMDLIPRGYIYNTFEEAKRDLEILQISEDIYQITCMTVNQINIYTDILTSEDIQNIYFGLNSLIKSLDFSKLIYLVHFPGWSPIVFKLREHLNGKVVYDFMDDHSGFSTNNQEVLEEEILLLKKSDLIITSSYKLEEKAKSYNPNSILVRNGTEFEHFHNCLPNGKLKNMKNPIIGYYGAIADWFDVEIIEYCAVNKRDWNYVLIGSTSYCDISPLKKLNNVHLLGEKPYKELPGYLYYFDVCIIPFKIISLTLATNPVKFYEYLSCGKPVVSVRLPELEQYSEYCYLADNKEDFLDKLEEALNERTNQELICKRIDLAFNNSWQKRFEQFKERIESL